MNQHFSAPWSRKLALLAVAFLAIIGVAAFEADGLVAAGFAGVVVLCAAFSVRGYSVAGETLLVHRLGWATRFDLGRLRGAEFSPGATLGSIRTFGIGGLFAFVGHYRNATLGAYRAFATDDARTVVLDFGTERVVVTPDRPAEFVAAVTAR